MLAPGYLADVNVIDLDGLRLHGPEVVAEALGRHVYAAGNSVEPGATCGAFRGRAATVQPLLEKRGLLPVSADA